MNNEQESKYDLGQILGVPVSGLKELPVLGRVEEYGRRKATGIDATESTVIDSAAHSSLEGLVLEYLQVNQIWAYSSLEILRVNTTSTSDQIHQIDSLDKESQSSYRGSETNRET